jgi:hypothetical protein
MIIDFRQVIENIGGTTTDIQNPVSGLSSNDVARVPGATPLAPEYAREQSKHAGV